MKIFTYFLVLFGMHSVYSQRLENMTNYPTTPQTTALFKAVSAPVTYYSGQPDVSLPLYTIEQDGINIPISISFNTSGILVTEESTNLGIGVRLNWGGSVIRSTNGYPDERSFFDAPYVLNSLNQELPKNYNLLTNMGCFPYCNSSASISSLTNRMQIYHLVNEYNDPYKNPPSTTDLIDLRPDDFNYNFAGKSGSFKFNQAQRTFLTYPLDDIKIEQNVINKILSKFDVTSNDGIKYTFGEDAIESTNKGIGFTAVTSTWFIKKITTSDNSVINFAYTHNRYTKYTESGSKLKIPAIQGNNYDPSEVLLGNMEYYESLIKTITFKSGKIEFIYFNDRVDANPTDINFSTNPGQAAPRLGKIEIYDKDNNIIKIFKFNQSYFTAFSSDSQIDNKRLRLDSMDILDKFSNVVETYQFEYQDVTTFPSKRSKARDHWGYYNGANNNTELIPTSLVPITFPISYFGNSWSGYDNLHAYFLNTAKGNRYINSETNKAYTIKKIKLPTGGEREFEFEDNKVRWSELYSQMKDISDDGYDIINKNFMVQGQQLFESYPLPSRSDITTTQKTVYSDEFIVQDYENTVLGEPTLYIRSNFVKPEISLSQLNSYPFRVEIGIEKKDGNVYTQYGGAVFDRTDQNITYQMTKMLKIPFLPNGTYRFYVKMITPPEYIMNQWTNSSGNTIQYGHMTVIGLTYRKKNYSDIRVGGLRIKNITDRDGSMEYKTSYEYTTADGYCSGHLVNLPEYKENIETALPATVPLNTNYQNPFNFILQTNSEPPFSVYNGYRICSEATIPLMKTQGSNVGYTNIIKKVIGGDKIIKEEFVYNFTPSLSSGYMKVYNHETEPRTWQSGKLLSHKQFAENTIVSEDIYEYFGMSNETDKGFVEEINTSLITGGVYVYAGFGDRYQITVNYRPNIPINYSGFDFFPNLYYFDNRYDIGWIGSTNSFNAVFTTLPLKIPYFRSFTGFDKIKSKTTINYFGSNTVTQTENYYYEGIPNNLQLTRQQTTGSSNEILETRFYYPQDLLSEPFMPAMTSANRIGNPVKKEEYADGVKISEEKFIYTQDASTGNLLKPKYVYSAKFPNNLPQIPNIGNLEKKATYDLYNTDGKLVQYTVDGGVPVVCLWGYGGLFPIAKIENATFNHVAESLGMAPHLLYGLTTAPANIRQLLPEAMITTYTYKPLVGVTSITDPKGLATSFEYDSAGRLIQVKDHQGNILSENEYHYKNN